MTDRRVSFAAIELELRWQVPGGEPLAATARELTYISSGGTVGEVLLECDVAPEAYARIDREQLFALTAGARGPGAEAFAPTGPVRLTLRLVDDELAGLLDLAPDPRAAADWIAELAGGDGAPALLSTRSWLALSVAEPVEPPDGGLEGGELARGYATTWATPARRLELGMLVVAGEVLEQRGWTYEELDDDTALGWRMSGPEGSWSSFAVAREAEGRFAIYSELDDRVAEDLRADAAALVARINWGLPIGNWELDMDDGALRCKTSIDIIGGPLSIALARRVIERNLAVVDAYLGALRSFAARQSSVEQALLLAEG